MGGPGQPPKGSMPLSNLISYDDTGDFTKPRTKAMKME